jgi:homoserine O-acetyltransferase
MISFILAALSMQAATAAPATWPTREAVAVLKDFHFGTGEVLANLRMHYTTLGTPHRNSTGQIDNAVLLLHGTGGDGHMFLFPKFADELYGPGQPLDVRKYWIILPDNIGHGQTSKPSDGLRMNFPKYDYADMVRAQHSLVTEALGLAHTRLILGTSMGCMHTFLWGEMYPNFSSALMALACEPVEVAGRNAMWRQLTVDAIKNDPAWKGGNYLTEPQQGLWAATSIGVVGEIPPLRAQALYPDWKSARAAVQPWVAAEIAGTDANDTIYQIEAARSYDPWPNLGRITAHLAWVNSADDFADPPELPFPRRAVRRMRNATFRLIPQSSETHGHATFMWASYWKKDLARLMNATAASY